MIVLFLLTYLIAVNALNLAFSELTDVARSIHRMTSGTNIVVQSKVSELVSYPAVFTSIFTSVGVGLAVLAASILTIFSSKQDKQSDARRRFLLLFKIGNARGGLSLDEWVELRSILSDHLHLGSEMFIEYELSNASERRPCDVEYLVVCYNLIRSGITKEDLANGVCNIAHVQWPNESAIAHIRSTDAVNDSPSTAEPSSPALVRAASSSPHTLIVAGIAMTCTYMFARAFHRPRMPD